MLHVKSTTSKSSKVKQRGKPPRTRSCLSVFAVVAMNHTNANDSPQPFQQLQHPYNCHVAWWSLCHRWRFRNHSCKHWKLEVAEIPLWGLLCRFLGGDEKPMATKLSKAKTKTGCAWTLFVRCTRWIMAAWKFSTAGCCNDKSTARFDFAKATWGQHLSHGIVSKTPYFLEGTKVMFQTWLRSFSVFSHKTTSSSSTAARPSASVRRR